MKNNQNIYHRKIKMAMIGGGPGSMIGEVHRKAARLDGEIDLLAGAFASTEEKSKQQGECLYLNPERVYASWKTMLVEEAKKIDIEKVDLISIVTPNYLHYEQAVMALEYGFHVVIDKPLTMTVKEAENLALIVKKTKKILGVTHTYTGYPMVKLAKDLIKQGYIGKIRKIMVEYPQGWLYKNIEKYGSKQARWRTNPKYAGIGGCIGDIGVHCANLSEYVTGLKISKLACVMTSVVDGRLLDDDANILVQWDKSINGVISASQVAVGKENDLTIYVYGDKASITWRNQELECLEVSYPDRPKEIWKKGWDYVKEKSTLASNATRLPAGHAEGYIEAFANIYRNVAKTIRCVETGEKINESYLDFPNVQDGVRGMKFIEAAVESGKQNGAWVEIF